MQPLCRYMFRFATDKPSQEDLRIVMLQVHKLEAKVAIIAGKDQSLPAVDFGAHGTRFDVADEAERQAKFAELAAEGRYQVFITSLPDVDTHVLFMMLREKTMRETLVEKKLFKFGKAILP